MSAESLAEALHTGLLELTGQAPDPGQEAALLSYLALLERWNRAYNLTAIKDPVQMVTRHLLDSLSVLPGSGAAGCWMPAPAPGFPEFRWPSQARPGSHSAGQFRQENPFSESCPPRTGPGKHEPGAGTAGIVFSGNPFRGDHQPGFHDLASFARAARHLASHRHGFSP